MKASVWVLLVLAVAPPCHAQTGSYPTTRELRDVLGRADALYSRFEQVTDRINFSRWSTSYEVSQNAKSALDSERPSIRGLRPLLGPLKTSGSASALVLVEALDEAHSVNSLAISLSFDSVGAADTYLAADLARTATEAVGVAASLKDVLSRYVAAQESELVACRQGRP